MLLIVALYMTYATLTGFSPNNPSSKEMVIGNEMEYYTSVTAWYDETDSRTIYIFYKEGNGVRKYYACSVKNGYDVFYNVTYNPCYRKCNNYTKNYRYECSMGVFNANLPKMK